MLILGSMGFMLLMLLDANALQTADPSFACLSKPGPLQEVRGFYNNKFEPPVAQDKKFDARGAEFEYPDTMSWQQVSLRAGPIAPAGMCWAGGFFTASTTWHDLDVSWTESKHGYDNTENDRGLMENTTSVLSYGDRMVWTGLHVYNMHDGIRTTHSDNNWTVQHVWLDYIRDDCIENDRMFSGTIYDSLFDGCYSGISVRPNRKPDQAATDQTIAIDHLLLRMEPMPYPYKWEKRQDLLYPKGYGGAPFGYGNAFKYKRGNVPKFKITNSVLLFEYAVNKTVFPPKDNVIVCKNNTIIWLDGLATAPAYLNDDFPGCFKIITDYSEGKAFWKRKVKDWHDRHPGVGSGRKAADPGGYSWPRYAAPDSTRP